MLFNKQLNYHNPEEGIYGDCYRTCIACILNLQPKTVPNFAQLYWDDNEKWDEENRKWLKERNLGIASIAFQQELSSLLEDLKKFNDIYFILTGRSRNNTNHAVVCYNGKIIHDPSIDNSGIIDYATDGYYHIELLIPLNY